LRVFAAKAFHYHGPFDPQLIKDLKHIERRAFLISALENYVPDNQNVLDAIDVFYMAFQQANFKGKARSMFKKRKKASKPYRDQTFRDPKTGETKLYRVYF